MNKLKVSGWPGPVVLQICAFLLLLATIVPTVQAQSAPLSFFQSGTVAVSVNPLDSSLWVSWSDFVTAQQNLYNVSHFTKDGQLFKTFQNPGNRHFLTMTFEPYDTRLYYEETTGFSPAVFTAFGYLDLETGQSHKLLDTASVPGGCTLASNYTAPPDNLYYNSARKQFYLPCVSYYNASGRPDEPSRTAIFDTTTGQLVKLVNFKPLALHPDGGKLYAYKGYYGKNNADPTDEYYDLGLVNDQSLEFTADKPLLEHQIKYNALTSFKVNSKTGLVYLTTRNCYAKCQNPQGAVFDRTGQAVVPFMTPKVMEYNWVNEANNQVYGPDTYAAQFGRSELAALDGSKVTGERLAQFYWTPQAIDQSRNLIYATQNDYQLYKPNNQASDMGLGLLVVNGNTNSVINFIRVRPPDQFYAEKAQPSPPPPDNAQGRYFTDTGHTLTGKFLAYWEQQGGLASFGYPITEPFEEYNPDIGKVRTVQYFERSRFELHPELAGSFYEVQLGLLGHAFSALTGPRVNPQYISGETGPIEGGLLFKETGHTVTGKFLAYWQSNGGLARHGLPLTQPTSEINPIDGKTYLVQYFERSRLELHPEFAGTRYEVLMGLLGTQSLRLRGWSV